MRKGREESGMVSRLLAWRMRSLAGVELRGGVMGWPWWREPEDLQF